MRKIMAVFAHPDDEGAIGGTITRYVDQGDEITLICATRGEVGEISDPSLATPETLGDVRQKELETACEALGIKHLEFLNYRDSGMDGTPENNDPRSFVQANPDMVISLLVRLIRQYQPDIVITFEPFGWYGHPDHKMTSKWVTAAYPLAGDETAFPNNGNSWQPQALYYAVLAFSEFKYVIEEAIKGGYITADDFGFEIPQEIVLATEAQITHRINVAPYYERAQEANRAHKTQFGEDNFFNKIPEDLMKKFSQDECYIQVYPTPDPSLRDHPRTDLFAGID